MAAEGRLTGDGGGRGGAEHVRVRVPALVGRPAGHCRARLGDPRRSPRSSGARMRATVDGPLTVPPPVALGVVTANAVVVGAIGVIAPIAWLLVPAMMATLSRPRLAVLVSLWASLLIGASVVVPVIPGHDADPWALAGSLVCLTLLPGMAWARGRGHARQLAHARRSAPGVTSLAAGDGARRAALAWAGLPAEVAASMQLPDQTVRVVLGVVAGEVPEPEWLRDRLEATFGDVAAHRTQDLVQAAAVLAELVRRFAPQGYVAAALVEIDREGAARLLSCGSPRPLILPTSKDHDEGLRVAGGGPGGPPLGLESDTAGRTEPLPDDCRVAVVTNAFALAHYDDYTTAAAESLRPATPEHAALLLLRGPTVPSRLIPGLEAGPVVGPALVLGPRQPRR